MRLKLNKESIVLFFISILLLVVFSYTLDYSALTSYDEAWYGEITRNLVASRNPFLLFFNGSPFTDHPPFGFILMAIPTIILGSSEFSVRFLSVFLGVGTILIVYLIGKTLSGRIVGASAAAILFSCMWFVFRVRSGNLDIPFLFWEVLTIYFLIGRKKIALYLASMSFAALILTKTLVGFGLLPVIIFYLFLKRNEIQKSTVFKALALLLILVLPWYIVSQFNDSNFLIHHFFEIGVRSTENVYSLESLRLNLGYLAIGVGKWYKIFLVSIILASITFFKVKNRFQQYNFLLLFIWGLGFSIFLLSSGTEIWHLLPLYPLVALLIPFTVFTSLNVFLPKISYLKGAFLLGFCFLALYQFHQFSNLTYFKEPIYSTEKDISIKASKYKNIYLMDTFFPSAVYYSQQNIHPLYLDQDSRQKMLSLLNTNHDVVIIINKDTKHQLEADSVAFSVLEENSSYSLIKKREF